MTRHRPTLLRRIASTLAALTLGVLVSAAMLEIGVRWFLGTQVRFPRRVVSAPWGLRINEPHAEYRHVSPDVSVTFRINGQGMRADRDFPVEKPPGVLRIVSLGDSFTAGYEVEAEETFSSVLEGALRARGLPVEVLNTGVSGFSTAEAYLYLERELWRYQPDLVLVSFYVNDLVDNVRTGLFALEDGQLVPRAEGYVPAGALGDFLNRNWLFSFLAEHSDAFALLKERANLLVKRRLVERNLRNLEEASPGAAAPAATPTDEGEYERALGAALLDALAEACRARGVPLVVQSIPFEQGDPPRLEDALPPGFDPAQPGVSVLSARDVLAPHLGRELLYWRRSHWHWTPFSHRVAGEALAEHIAGQGLLARPAAPTEGRDRSAPAAAGG